MTERLRHLEAGILSLRRATELSPSRGLYWNTLAAALWETSGAGSLLTASEGLPPGDDALKLSVSDLDRTRAVALVAQRMTTPWNMIASELFQSVCQSARALSVGVLPPFLPDDMMLRADLTRRCWVERSISAYAQAYKLGRAEEGDRVDDGFGPSARFVTREAGEAVLRLIHERGVREDDWPTLYAVETELERAGQDIPRAISPIILSLESAQPMAALTSSAVVSFDLDGTGSARWTWVKPSTGILVWDPERKGQITSGLQLFGSVTFWMFWRNGYVALDTLDDNRDGWLTEAELTGLGIWFDRNSNGVSDPGEVVPVARVGVAGLATHEDGREGEGWVSVHGVRMTDGRTLPTYDWIAHRVDEVADGSQVLQCAATDGE